MEIIMVICGLGGAAAFVTAFFKDELRFVALRYMGLFGFAAAAYFLVNVKTDVGILCSVIIAMMAGIMILLAEIGEYIKKMAPRP